MGTPLYMELGDACRLVQEYAELHTGNDVLAALKDMQECYDDLDKEDRVAYNMFMAAGREMFKAKDDPNVYYGA
jgi:hypothetical protein